MPGTTARNKWIIQRYYLNWLQDLSNPQKINFEIFTEYKNLDSN